MKNCNCHTTINRDGSGQLGRYLKTLDPGYIPVDERSIEELLVFIKRYAAQIRFYDIPGTEINDNTELSKVSWKEFFGRDMAVIAASVSQTDTWQIKKNYDDIRGQIELHPGPHLFSNLFDPILGMAARIDNWYSVAVPENPFHDDLKLAIDSSLRTQMKLVRNYEAAFKTIDPKNPLNLDYTAIKNDEIWGLNDEVVPDNSIYDKPTEDKKILNAVLFVDDVFNNFYKVINNIKERSGEYMRFALEEYPAHQPHMALFIAFLQLFKLAQDQANGLTERMLNFYYRDVLRLTEKPSAPDKVHVVFELASDVAEYDLPKGTALTAGDDTSGKDQVYKTDSDFVINQAKVKELKTIFIEKTGEGDSTTVTNIYARPVANSLDGFGEKFTDPNPKWPTFGKGNTKDKKVKNICDQLLRESEQQIRNDQGRVGIAYATPQLLLKGGKRLIQIGIKAEAENLEKLVKSLTGIEIWLTGEKGWVKIGGEQDGFDDLQKKFIEHFKSPDQPVFPGGDEPESFYFVDAGRLVNVYLPLAEQPIVAFDPAIHTGYDFRTSYPVMIMLNRPSQELNIPENIFSNITLTNTGIRVKVGSISTPADKFKYFDGLKTLILQNEMGILPTNKPFDPFTPYPLPGKILYIGSNEIFSKPIADRAEDQLSININKTLDTEAGEAAGAFQELYAVNILNKRDWIDVEASKETKESDTFKLSAVKDKNIRIFTQDTLAQNILDSSSITIDRTYFLNNTEWTNATEKGFIRLTLLFPRQQDASGIAAFSRKFTFEDRQNLAPLLEIKEISVSYRSLLLRLDPETDQFFHVYPFGVAEIYVKNDDLKLTLAQNVKQRKEKTFATLDKEKDYLLINAGKKLFPQFTYLGPYRQYKPEKGKATPAIDCDTLLNNVFTTKTTGGANQYSALIQEEGMLFIGLENMQPLQIVSLLFQFADGTAEDEDKDPPGINWSYLTNNEWRPLKKEDIVEDETFGFETTGIVKINLPGDATSHNTLITKGYHWLCASVTKDSNRIPMLIDVVTQATLATFSDNDNDQSHFDKALAAGSISKLTIPVDAVSKVEQPFSSFDGKHKEIGKEFYYRVSERLRHKGRAITAWDYEHLVLDRFPSVYKVKCITHTDPECLCYEPDEKYSVVSTGTCCGPQVAPGHVLLVPISDFKNRNAVNPLQPKTGRLILLEIEKYLKKLCSPFVQVHAKNPEYEQVLVFFRVKFLPEYEKGFYMKKLNDEIVRFLTPWAFDEKAEVKFGEKIYASSIINFIEERKYVDFITDFLICICRNECCPGVKKNTETKDASAAAEKNEVAGAADEKGSGKNKIAEMLDKICNCDDIIVLMQEEGQFKGEVVAKPSGPRSILVSVPQHIIVPYEEDEDISLCEQRKLAALTIKDMDKTVATLVTGSPEKAIATADTSKKSLIQSKRKK